MNTRQTVETVVTGPVYIWAVPLTPHEHKVALESDPEALPYRFDIMESDSYHPKAYTGGAIFIYKADVTVVVPEGLDFLEAALKQLREEKIRKQRKFEEEIEQLDAQIRQLAQLEYIPAEVQTAWDMEQEGGRVE